MTASPTQFVARTNMRRYSMLASASDYPLSWAPAALLDSRPEPIYSIGRQPTRKAGGHMDLLQGTLDLLILQTLAPGRAHGHAIAQSIERRSKEVLQVGHGSLYPALQRLLKQGLIVAEDGQSENNRKARFYRLTPKGRKRLSLE